MEKTPSTRKRQTGVLSKSSKIEENKAKQIELTSRYLYEKNETVKENAKIITLINEFKTLYVGDSFTPKQNKQRIEKLALLFKYFSNHNNNQDWHLDEKGYLLYKNIKTMNRFVTYIDLFLKYPEEIPQGTKLPIFFQELFLNRIMSDYSKFSPTVHYTPDDHKKKFENSTKTKNDDKILKVYIKITNDQSRVLSRINVFFDQMSNLLLQENNYW